MHLMTGNISHQIEHHLFPDLPSNRYAEIGPVLGHQVGDTRVMGVVPMPVWMRSVL